MSVSVTLDNQRAFSREAMTLLLGGGAAGLVVTGLNFVAGSPVPQLTALSFGAVVGLMANLSDSQAGTPMLRLVVAILGGILMAVLAPVHWALAGAVGGLCLGAAFSLDEEGSVVERGFSVGLYSLLLVGGLFTSGVLADFLDVPVLRNVFEGLTWGVFLAFAGGLKRLRFSRDPVIAEFDDAAAELEMRERETVVSGRVLYDQIVQELDRLGEEEVRERASEIASETSRALIALSRRSQELREAAERVGQRQLDERIVELDTRIRDSRDATVRRELEVTLEELVEQLKARKRFDVARARVEARQQRCFTALERLHVSLVQGTAGAADPAVQESIGRLEKLSDEIHWRNLSVEELCADNACGTEGIDTEDVVAELREGRETEQTSDATDAGETVLDSGTAADDAPEASAPQGTDGTLDVREEQAHARVDQNHSS